MAAKQLYAPRHRVWGRLFGDRYKAVLVEGKKGYYYETLLDYIHLNPVRAKLVRPRRGQSVLDYKWSSVAGGHALPARKRPKWLATEAVLEAFGCEDTASGRRKWVERLDRRAVEEEGAKCGLVPLPEEMDARSSHLRRGWYWGGQAFAEKLLRMAGALIGRDRSRMYRGSLERRAHDTAKAEHLLQEGLQAAGLDLSKLQQLPGSDVRKVAIARAIWQQTVVPQKWLAQRLSMRSATNVSQQLRRHAPNGKRRQLPPPLRKWLLFVNN